MDWTQTLTILISVFGLFLVAVPFLISRMDNKFEQLLNRMDANQKENNAKFEAINGKFDAVNTRFNGLENRLTSMESEIKSVNQNLGQRIESTNQRIENTNQRIESTNQRITDFKTDMNQRLSTIEGYLVPKKVFHFEEPDHKDEPKEN